MGKKTKTGQHTKQVGSIHDQFFKSVFNQPSTIAALLELALTQSQLSLFDLQTIAIENRRWQKVQGAMDSEADLVVSVQLQDGKGIAVHFLVEHKSQSTAQLMHQLLSYQTHLYVSDQAKAVIPVVVYHGTAMNWPPWRTFQRAQFQDLPDRFQDLFALLLLNFGMIFMNLNETSVQQKRARLPLDVQLPLEMLAGIREASASSFIDMIKRVRSLDKTVRFALLQKIAKYLTRAHPDITMNQLSELAHATFKGEQMMQDIDPVFDLYINHQDLLDQRLAEGIEQGRKEGEKKGREEGEKKTLRHVIDHLTKQGFSDDEVSKLISVSIDQVRALLNR